MFKLRQHCNALKQQHFNVNYHHLTQRSDKNQQNTTLINSTPQNYVMDFFSGCYRFEGKTPLQTLVTHTILF